MDLLEKVAIVTGGASGFGEGVVRRFIKDGAKVAIFDRNEILGQKLADELGENVLFCHVDVVNDNSVSAGIEQALNEPNEQGERGIINTASIAAVEGQTGHVAYAATKGAVVSMTLPIARDLAHYGIRSATIAPGLCETPILKNVAPEVKEKLAKAIPFPKRLAEPSEFADLAVSIIKNSYTNRETIRLDGGLRL